MTFAQRIARILELTKETRASLVKRTGISKTALNDFLAGRTDPSFATTVALIQAFPEYNARALLTGVRKRPVEKPVEPESNSELNPKVERFIQDKDKTIDEYKNAIVRAVSLNQGAIEFLLNRMKKGEVDGTVGFGKTEECYSCLFGTLAKAKGVWWYKEIPGYKDDSWTAEAWFCEIKLGDTPSTNEFARLAYEWISEYQRSVT